MFPLSKTAILVGSICVVLRAQPAAAETFEERWSIIPPANAEPAPEPEKQNEQKSGTPVSSEPDVQTQSPIGAHPIRETTEGSEQPSAKQTFWGRASFYSYESGRTASGAPFDREALTAAHRSLPFGTRVRVTDPATSKSVEVTITDRGPKLPSRILDLSLGAARILGITDRGVVQVHAEIL